MKESNEDNFDVAFSEFAKELLLPQIRPKKRTANFSKKDNIREFVDSIKLGELIFYSEIFGTEKLFKMKSGDENYIVFDSYCVAPDCDCTETRLSFTKESKKSKADEDFSFTFDYKNGKIDSISHLKH